MIRTRVKSAAEVLLVRSGLPWAASRLRRGRSVVLAYHNVVPAGVRVAGDPSLHLPQDRFAEQLDVLLEACEVISLDRLRDTGDGMPTHRPRVVITLDDAYRGAVTLATEELARRGLPATIFVAPALLGGQSFWWDTFVTKGGLPERLRRHAIEALRGEDPVVRDWARRSGFPEQTPSELTVSATEAELREATRHDGITLGSHGWSHANLAALPPQRLEEELLRPLEWLQERFPCVVPWLSCPYNLGSTNVETAAARAGYRGAFRVGATRAARARTLPFGLPRVNVPAGLSRNGLALRLAGVRSS